MEVLAITGVLAAAGLWVGMQIFQVHQEARDAERISAAYRVRNGIERYFAEMQAYPAGEVAIGARIQVTDCVAQPCRFLTRENGWTGILRPNDELFLAFAPGDPLDPDTRCTARSTQPCQYTYRGSADGYAVYFFLERGIANFPAGVCKIGTRGIQCEGGKR